MEKAFGKSETNAEFFYDLLHNDAEGIPDEKIDGSQSEPMADAKLFPPPTASGTPDNRIQGHEAVALAFNRITKYFPKISEHFQALGLDLSAMIGTDGAIKAEFAAKITAQLLGKDSAVPKKALSFQSAQLLIAEREQLSTRDPAYAEKFKAFMDLPTADRDAQLKKFYGEPKNVGKLVRWAFRFSEFSLLPFKDQVEIFRQNGFDEGVVKAELGSLWQGRGLPKLVAQAALLKGLELEEQAKSLEGDAAQKKGQEARMLFRAAVELDNQNPLARRRLSTYLLREGKMPGASFHLAEAVKSETELRYLVEIVQGLEIGDKRLLDGHSDPLAFVADNLVVAKRYGDAAALFHEAAKTATARGDHALSLALTEKEMRVEEVGKPYTLSFTAEQNPIAMAFYKALSAQGMPSGFLDGQDAALQDGPDRKITPTEIFGYLDSHWKDSRVQSALKSINFPVLPWDVEGTKPAYVDAAFEKLSFAAKMAASHQYEIAELRKKQPLEVEVLEKRLRLASYYEPNNLERHRAVGDFYLTQKNYTKAVSAFQTADTLASGGDLKIKTALGHALYGKGDFKAARDMYSVVLEKNPKEVESLKFRLETNQKYAATLDTTKDAAVLKTVQTELVADGGMILALTSKDEKAKLADMEKLLGYLHTGDVDKARVIAGMAGMEVDPGDGISKKDAIAAVEGLAEKYLALADQSYKDPKDVELVRGELNGLAAESFSVLSRFAAADSDPEIKRMSAVYEGYALVAQGKIDEAIVLLKPLRKIPQADRILTKLEKGHLRLVNLSAVEAWDVYNKDMERAETDSAKGWASGTSVKSVTDKWAKETAIATAVKEKLVSGEADNIEGALKLIADSGSTETKERAKYYLSTDSRANGTGPIGDLISYVAVLPASASDAQRILDKSFDAEAKKGAVESAFAMYAIIQATSPEAEMKKKAQVGMDALQGKAGFGRSVEKFFTANSGSGLAVDVGLMFLAAGLGNLAKLRMLAKLESAGVNGYKAVAIANAIGIGTEATALWGANTVKAAMLSDPSKVFSTEHLLKSYGSTLLMIGGLKGFGKLGEGLGPRAAKSLGLVTETGVQLTKTGKVLVWGIGHTSGLGGMIATSHANQALGLTPKPIGGWKEGLVHDVFGYVQFAIAHKVADGVVKGKMTQVSQRQHTEVAFREAVLMARGHAETLGFKAERFEIKNGKDGKLQANGKDFDTLDPAVKVAVEKELKKGKDDKVEDQVVFLESPERKLLVGLFVQTSLNRPGFAGGKLAKLLAKKDYLKANEYLKEFQVPLHFDAQGELVAGEKGEPSPHEALGIVPPGEEPLTDPKVEGEKGKPAAPKTAEEEIPFVDADDVVLLEDGMVAEPPKLAARKGKTPPPKKGAVPKAADSGQVKPLAAMSALPDAIRVAMAINNEGHAFEVSFNEAGIALLGKNGKTIPASEGTTVPHVEIQMTVTDRGEVVYQVRAVGAEKLQIVDGAGKVEEVTAVYRPLQEGDRLRIAGNEYSWHGPRSREALVYKTKAVTVFDGRAYLEDASAIQERAQWAESFVKTQEKEYVARPSLFGDAARIFAERIAKDPRMSSIQYREAFTEHCSQVLKALRPIVDRLPTVKRSDLAYSFLRQVIDGQITLSDAKILATSVESGNVVIAPVGPEIAKRYDYVILPAIKGVPIPKKGGMLESLKGAIVLDFGKTVYQNAQIGETALQFRSGKASVGQERPYLVMNRGDKATVELYDSVNEVFIPLPTRREVPIKDGAILRVGGQNFIFRSPEAMAREAQSRQAILDEREALIGKRAQTSSSFEFKGAKGTHPENLEKLEQDFRDQMAAASRDEDGVQDYAKELAQLSLGDTEFSGPARLAIAGKLTPTEYRQAQTKIGEKLVAQHEAPLEEVDSFLNGLSADALLSHRFADLKGENGEWVANPHTRLKMSADIAPKLSRRGWTDLGPLTDVAGARVVVRSTNDVLPIVEAIEKEYKVRDQVSADGTMEMDIIGEETVDGKEMMEVTSRPDKDHPDRLTIGTSSGYRAMHVVVEVDGKPVEIQIQTEAIYQWGKIQHSLVYKNKNLPKATLDELNVFCRDAAKYLTDLESGPSTTERPSLPLLSKHLKPELRVEIDGDLKKMGDLLDRYENLAEDPSHHSTKIFKRPESSPNQGAAEPVVPEAKNGASENTQADGPKAKEAAKDGRIPARRAVPQPLSHDKSEVPSVSGAKAAKTGTEVAKLRASNGKVFVLPRNKTVITLGSKEGEVDVDIGHQATKVAPVHAEIVKGVDGQFHLRPIDGQDVYLLEGGKYRRLKTTPQAEMVPLREGARIKIGSWEFEWKVDRPPPLPPPKGPKPPPLPTKRGSEAGFERLHQRTQGLKIQLVQQVEASDATLSGERSGWTSATANSFIPDRTHSPIKTSWKHTTRAEYDAAATAGKLQDTPATVYSAKISGKQRLADVQARLKATYGPRLQETKSVPGETTYLIRNEKGEAQAEVVLQSAELKTYSPKEAREIYARFAKSQLATLLEWASESNTNRSFYAFRIIEMIGVSGDGQGGNRFGTRLHYEVEGIEKAPDPVSKRRAEEELATTLAYLLDVGTLIPEYRMLNAVRNVQDRESTTRAVAYALKQPGEWHIRGEAAQTALLSLRRLSDRTRTLGEELRANVAPEHRKAGNPVYDEYAQSLKELQQAAKTVVDLQKDLANSGVDLKPETRTLEVEDDMILDSQDEPTKAGAPKRDLRGADDHPIRDLRNFTEDELEGLKSVGLTDVSGLRDPADTKFASAVRDSLSQLLQKPHKSREYESAVIRLVGALKHWERATGGKIPWLDGYLKNFGRNSYGLSLESMPPPSPPPSSIPLSKDERQGLGVTELNAGNVMSVITTIRTRSTKLEKVGDFIPFHPNAGDKRVLRRIIENYGAVVQAANPKLATYLGAIFRPGEAYVSSLDVQDQGDGGNKLPERRESPAVARKAPVKFSGEPTGAYVENISLASVGGQDLKSFADPRPSYVGEIPNLTPKLERIFDRGGRVEKWSQGMMLVENPSGAQTAVTRPATEAETLAYSQWHQKQGFAAAEAAKVGTAWKQFEARAKDMGIELFLGDDASQGVAGGKALQDFLDNNGAQVIFLNRLLDLLPATLLGSGGVKKIFLKTPSQGDAAFSAFDASDGSLYLYSGGFTGSRRNLAGLFFHEIGHPTAERYRTDGKGDKNIRLSTRIQMHEAHRLLAKTQSLFAVDWAEGSAGRLEKQSRDFDEFIADLHLAYVTAGPSLRAHIRSFPEGSPERAAWNTVYGEMRDRIFGGLEYDFTKMPPLPPKPTLKSIDGGKKPPPPPTAIEVPQAFLDSQIGAHNAIQSLRLPGVAAGRDLGVGKYKTNEDRFVVVPLKSSDGKPMTRYFVIDGMGGYEGGEFAAVFTQYVLETAAKNPYLSMEAIVKLADKKITQHPEFHRLKKLPGAVLAGVQAKQISPELYELRMVDVGDSEAMVFHENFELKENAYTAKEPQSSVKLSRGQTLISRLHPHAHMVDQALGGHFREGRSEIEVGVEVHYARKGSVVVVASDGVTENYTSKDEIGQVLRESGGRNEAELELALRNETLIRMHVYQNFRKAGRYGQKITHEDFVTAYTEVWKKPPPPGTWRYEGLALIEKGRVVDPTKDPLRDGTTAYFRGTFKLDNLSVIVQILGGGSEGPGQGSEVRPDFLPVPFSPLVAKVAVPPSPLRAQGGRP